MRGVLKPRAFLQETPLANQSLGDSPVDPRRGEGGRYDMRMCVSLGVGMTVFEGWRCGFPIASCGGVAGPDVKKHTRYECDRP